MITWIDGKGVTLNFPRDAERIKQYIDYVNNEPIEGIKCGVYYNSDPQYDLKFLSSIKNPQKIKKLSIYNASSYDEIYRFSEIEELSLNPEKGEAIDLVFFPKLRELHTTRLGGFKNLSIPKIVSFLGEDELFQPELVTQMGELTDIKLYSAKGFSFINISKLNKLKYASFTQCNIKDLSGIEAFQDLGGLYFSHCRSLTNIDGIEILPDLNTVWLSSCPKLSMIGVLAKAKSLKKLVIENVRNCDFSFLKELKNLVCLGLDNCGSIPSASFINELPNLKTFTFCNTNILDGDLTPCMRLKFAHTLDKRHYNLKCGQLPHDYKYSLSAPV